MKKTLVLSTIALLVLVSAVHAAPPTREDVLARWSYDGDPYPDTDVVAQGSYTVDDYLPYGCTSRITFQGEFDNTPDQKTGWVVQTLLCDQSHEYYPHRHYTIITVHETDPRYTGTGTSAQVGNKFVGFEYFLYVGTEGWKF